MGELAAKHAASILTPEVVELLLPGLRRQNRPVRRSIRSHCGASSRTCWSSPFRRLLATTVIIRERGKHEIRTVGQEVFLMVRQAAGYERRGAIAWTVPLGTRTESPNAAQRGSCESSEQKTRSQTEQQWRTQPSILSNWHIDSQPQQSFRGLDKSEFGSLPFPPGLLPTSSNLTRTTGDITIANRWTMVPRHKL